MALLLNLIPQVKDSSLLAAASILSAAIEIVGFIMDRSAEKDPPPDPDIRVDLSGSSHTNFSGDQEIAFSGSFDGPTSARGDAVDMRESAGSINVAAGPVNQHFGNITQIIRPPEKKLIPRIQRPPQNFVGRVEEINRIFSSFEHGAVIVCLQGMGGVGKTALALEFVKRMGECYPDGQIFVNMKGTSKNSLSWTEAMIQVIHAYDLEYKMPASEDELRGRYSSILHSKKTLLLLDDAASREQVEPLLPPKKCALLATSRNRFALKGLKIVDLEVLPLEDAESLLLKIAGRIGEKASELAQLCGCLPIALENAAYVVMERRDLSVADYMKRLKDANKRLELVEASFSTSYDLLTPELQRFWSLLSVFPADFDLAGAAAVWEMEEMTAEDALGELVKWSLVDFLPCITGEGGRYKLHDLARDFAESRLETDASENAEQRHAMHYLVLLWTANWGFLLGGSSQSQSLIQFDTEYTNIKTGQKWAAVNSDKSNEIAEICSNFALPPILNFCRNSAQTNSPLNLRLHPLEFIEWLKAALYSARKTKNLKSEAAHLQNLGMTYIDLGETQKSIDYYEQALDISRALADQYLEECCLGSLGNAFLRLSEARKAIKYFEQALIISRGIRDSIGEEISLGNLGNANFELGETQKAISYYEQAFIISEKIRDQEGKGRHLLCQGSAYNQLGEMQKAIDFYNKSLNIFRSTGDLKGEGLALGGLGNTYSNQGEMRKAIENYKQWLGISRKIGDKKDEGDAMGNLGLAYYYLGDLQEAIKYDEQSLKISREIGDRRAEGDTLFNMSLVMYPTFRTFDSRFLIFRR